MRSYKPQSLVNFWKEVSTNIKERQKLIKLALTLID